MGCKHDRAVDIHQPPVTPIQWVSELSMVNTEGSAVAAQGCFSSSQLSATAFVHLFHKMNYWSLRGNWVDGQEIIVGQKIKNKLMFGKKKL